MNRTNLERWILLSALAASGCAAGGAAGTGGGGAGGTGGNGGSGGSSSTACQTSADCGALDGLCTEGKCVDGVCEALPANDLGGCDDGLFCTVNDSCQAGKCEGAPRPCASQDTCHVGTCDEEQNKCVDVPGNDGAPCDDVNACTQDGTCVEGVCKDGPALDCSFLDGPCRVGTCDPFLGCTTMPAGDGAACDDKQFCTVGEVCQGGQCVGGTPNPCQGNGGCMVGLCDEANDTCQLTPGNEGKACEDGSPCTAGTTCSAGLCLGGGPTNDGGSCDDGLSCTTGEVCAAGACGGGVGPEIYFSEDFANNAKGWILGPEWEIGPAVPPKDPFFPYGQDPDTDHSAGSDNGVAGVILGGPPQQLGPHPFYFLESPPFDTSMAQGKVILGFWRWLNSECGPLMRNAIQVHDGTSWNSVWTSGNAPPCVIDAPPDGQGWTYVSYDLTAFKNAAMRIRFGFLIQQQASVFIGSWNVDDVLVASDACN
ncbi:hypothetical protein [Polyangium aurulentum]|uniref:hypothetical protein n=1 Tax=Polyangium aurulentum TaxID=2567896 RepID=UPI0010AE2A9C|nr:hypothetical protein [Polyangium aurulentum]UQA57259.1 hypothetical protein E8A73_039160 [Polyangium aurulentum]